MAKLSREDKLVTLAKELKNSFDRWDHLAEHGGSDPFWADGFNMNLVRNHIDFYKEEIEKVIQEESEELSLFGLSYPDIYHRATPDRVDDDFMAKADEIRQRAAQQLALYEKDPNFQYILENHDKVFPKGETRATKAAGLDIFKTSGLWHYRKTLESGNLVDMRRDFFEPYEEKAKRWTEGAQKLKAFLEAEHDPADNVIVKSEYEDDEDIPEEAFEEEEVAAPAPSRKLSLDKQIQGAKERNVSKNEVRKTREEQMSLF